MKIPIENWLEEQDLTDDSRNLAREAILCYKNSAYRAALLFSYLMFQTIIKDRILISKKPEAIPEGLWESTRTKLIKDEDWDKAAFQATQLKDDKSIFLISDDLRRQVEYWKDRRNDCAHYKKNEITYAHVEAFWQFLTSNLPKFMVNGGKVALLEKVKIMFDTTYTRPGHDPSLLVRNISLIVERHEMEGFFQEVHRMFSELHWFYPMDLKDEQNLFDMFAFWKNVLTTSELQEAAVQFVKTIPELFAVIISLYPHLLNLFTAESGFLRSFWQTQLKKMYYLENYWELVLAFLVRGLIPEDERRYFFISILPDNIKDNIPSIQQFQSLNAFGFSDFYKKYLFEDQENLSLVLHLQMPTKNSSFFSSKIFH